MAASVHTSVKGNNVMVLNVRSLGTDETDANILDISALAGPYVGAAPTKLRIDEIFWTVNGFTYVLLEFDRTTDYVIDYFAGQGYMDFRPQGGKVDKGTGGTGDLLLTSVGGGATTSYSFIIHLRLKA